MSDWVAFARFCHRRADRRSGRHSIPRRRHADSAIIASRSPRLAASRNAATPSARRPSANAAKPAPAVAAADDVTAGGGATRTDSDASAVAGANDEANASADFEGVSAGTGRISIGCGFGCFKTIRFGLAGVLDACSDPNFRASVRKERRPAAAMTLAVAAADWIADCTATAGCYGFAEPPDSKTTSSMSMQSSPPAEGVSGAARFSGSGSNSVKSTVLPHPGHDTRYSSESSPTPNAAPQCGQRYVSSSISCNQARIASTGSVFAFSRISSNSSRGTSSSRMTFADDAALGRPKISTRTNSSPSFMALFAAAAMLMELPISTSQRNTRCAPGIHRGFLADEAENTRFPTRHQACFRGGGQGGRRDGVRSGCTGPRGRAKPSPKGRREAARRSPPSRTGRYAAVRGGLRESRCKKASRGVRQPKHRMGRSLSM